MSLHIIKAGLLDSFQDRGRPGYQHQGISTGGTMDAYAAAMANALLGKECKAPVLECHFPAATILMEEPMLICISGADFHPQVNGQDIALNQPVVVGKGSRLQFRTHRAGMRCYIAFGANPVLDYWLNSYSTHFGAVAGGFKGRKLVTGDQVLFQEEKVNIPAPKEGFRTLPWKASTGKQVAGTIGWLPGPEWHWLSQEAKDNLMEQPFFINPDSDRMGLRLNGNPLEQVGKQQLVSSPVNFGTVQLLPNGQLIILMADHQTTGGYPRIGNIISTHLPILAQKQPGQPLYFARTTLEEAEAQVIRQNIYFEDLKQSCRLRLASYL